MKSTSGLSIWPKNWRAYALSDSTYLRWPSAKIVSNASDDLPEPDNPENTMRASRGNSRSTPLRLCSRAPRTTNLSFTTPPYVKCVEHVFESPSCSELGQQSRANSCSNRPEWSHVSVDHPLHVRHARYVARHPPRRAPVVPRSPCRRWGDDRLRNVRGRGRTGCNAHRLRSH